MMRILLADDHPIVRRHVRNVLIHEKGWEVCAEATTGREAVAMTATARPDLVVLDLSMPELTGLEAARLIHEQFPEMEMILLTLYDPYELMDQLAASGVRTCVMKTDLQDLVDAIREVTKPRPVTSKHPSNTASDLHGSHEDEKVHAPKC
jgi:DNA-binding NarL/FixJ family response regulator